MLSKTFIAMPDSSFIRADMLTAARYMPPFDESGHRVCIETAAGGAFQMAYSPVWQTFPFDSEAECRTEIQRILRELKAAACEQPDTHSTDYPTEYPTGVMIGAGRKVAQEWKQAGAPERPTPIDIARLWQAMWAASTTKESKDEMSRLQQMKPVTHTTVYSNQLAGYVEARDVPYSDPSSKPTAETILHTFKDSSSS